jgi:hypothetical protein
MSELLYPYKLEQTVYKTLTKWDKQGMELRITAGSCTGDLNGWFD